MVNESAERWERRYRAGRIFGDSPNRLLVKYRRFLIDGRTLLVADGYGRNGLWLARQGITVDAFDIAPSAVSEANADATFQGLAYRSQAIDAASGLPHDLCDRTYANIVSIWPHVDHNNTDYKSQAGAALAPGGRILLVTSIKLSPPRTEIAQWPQDLDWTVRDQTDRSYALLGVRAPTNPPTAQRACGHRAP